MQGKPMCFIPIGGDKQQWIKNFSNNTIIHNLKLLRMKKKEYEKPSMKVYELQQRAQLLAGSNGDGTLPGMGDPEDL